MRNKENYSVFSRELYSVSLCAPEYAHECVNELIRKWIKSIILFSGLQFWTYVVILQEQVIMQFCAHKLDKKDFFGKSDPFLTFYRANEDNR